MAEIDVLMHSFFPMWGNKSGLIHNKEHINAQLASLKQPFKLFFFIAK